MTTEEELKRWVKTLSPSEKRFVNLIGRARAGAGSQLLDLFEWLNKAEDDEPVPAKAPFKNNLPTLATRLRELILDSLRVLNKESDVDASLRSSLDEIAIMFSKKHSHAAARQLRKTKKTAYEASRYTIVLQCIETEFMQAAQLPPDQVGRALERLRMEEEDALKKHQQLRELRFRHDSLLALAKQHLFSRNPQIAAEAAALGDDPLVHEQLASEHYLESALAVNTLGVLDLLRRNTLPAIERYRQLLASWKENEKWQADQPDLLMSVCMNYQNVCFFSTMDPGVVHADLLSLRGFNGLPEGKLRAFRETLFHHQFILSLNNGKPEVAVAMIPEIETWMQAEEAHLSETQVLPFLCNFAVAEFFAENFSNANKYLTRILALPNKKARADVREFALVLQPVIQHELGNTGLNEYLTRSGKRHFSKTEAEGSFELVVLRNIELLMRAGDGKETKEVLAGFIAELEQLMEQRSGAAPLLGLNEIYMWAVSRRDKVPLPEVFLEEVRKARASGNYIPE